MKNFKYKFLLVIVVVMSVITFFGCSDVSFMVVQYPNGEILQSFSVILNKTSVESAGYNYDVSVQKVKVVLEDALLKFKERFLLTSELSAPVKEQVMNNTLTLVEQEEQVISAQIRFNNITDYKYFYNLSDSSSAYTKVEKNPFFNKNISQRLTNFYNFQQDEIIKNAVIEMQNYFSTNQVLTIDNINFSYCYAVPSRAHIYSDADYIFNKNGIDFHVWQLKSDNLDRVIEFFTISIKPLTWYVLALALTLMLLGILLIIVKIKDKKLKNKNKNQELLLNNIDFDNKSDIINE